MCRLLLHCLVSRQVKFHLSFDIICVHTDAVLYFSLICYVILNFSNIYTLPLVSSVIYILYHWHHEGEVNLLEMSVKIDKLIFLFSYNEKP